MKKFLIKVTLYIVILLAIILPVSSWLFKKVPKHLLLVSNSVSYNLKADFIRQHPEKLDRAGVVVVGSSMSLNNVDAKMIQDSLRLPVINLASWALNIQNYQNSPIWDEHKIFLSNIGIPDFGESRVIVKDNYSFNTSRVREWFNFETDIKTSLGMLQQAREVMSIPDNSDYKSCNFDECGSVLFCVKGFTYDSLRWNADEFVKWGVDSARLKAYVSRLKELTRSHHGYSRIIISFSPVRRKFYSAGRSGMIAYLGGLIRENCPDVTFFNLFDRDYPDSVFADNCHFNVLGAGRFTGEVIDSMRAREVMGR